ncbi:hypothetical protein COMA2_20286 [Candidatus Nitrospira nitrificans]|uniref:Uncharacterized protein n=1 Tax=Candidatus Nitrospira nitrificans TaxID=1742973 RepID=A0A0S4LK55_9BACT|nr:hypothetical protein COMA2_20286 [Candidatus Nitrospira nitrificans]
MPIDSGRDEQTMAVPITVRPIPPFVEMLGSIRYHDDGRLFGDLGGWRAFSHFHR